MSWLTSIKYEKQLRKGFEATNDPQTAKKAWSDYIVSGYLYELDLTCDSKPLPYIDINPIDLNYITRK